MKIAGKLREWGTEEETPRNEVLNELPAPFWKGKKKGKKEWIPWVVAVAGLDLLVLFIYFFSNFAYA